MDDLLVAIRSKLKVDDSDSHHARDSGRRSRRRVTNARDASSRLLLMGVSIGQRDLGFLSVSQLCCGSI